MCDLNLVRVPMWVPNTKWETKKKNHFYWIELIDEQDNKPPKLKRIRQIGWLGLILPPPT